MPAATYRAVCVCAQSLSRVWLCDSMDVAHQAPLCLWERREGCRWYPIVTRKEKPHKPKNCFQSCGRSHNCPWLLAFFSFFLYLFIWMHWVLVVAQRIFSLHCGMETLSGGMWWQLPDQGLNLGPLHWELSLSQCTTRGSPDTGLFIAWRISDYLSFSWHSECSPPDLFFMHWTLMMWTIWVPVIVQAVDSHQLYRV